MKIKIDFSIKFKPESGTLLEVSYNGYFFSLKDKSKDETRWGKSRIKPHWWKYEREGLYKDLLVALPFGLDLHGYKETISYAEAVGLNPNITIDWLLDEFDSSFNEIAVASLRYHMDWSVAICSPEKRKKYQALVNKFETKGAELTEEDLQHLENCRPMSEFFNSPVAKQEHCETCEKIFENLNQRSAEVEQIIKEARHEFVEIMPTLWS